MKKTIKLVLLIMINALLLTQIAFSESAAVNFSDLDETHWAHEGIYKLIEKGIIVGYPDGTFKPEGNVTRAELVKIVNMVFEYTQKEEATNLTDVNAEDWFYDNVLIAQQAGYIVGYPDGTFKPEGLITREEFCKVLDSINGFVELPFDNTIIDEVSPWAMEYVNRVVSNRIMVLDENNNFRAVENATRAEVSDALAKFIVEDTIEDGRTSDNDTDGGAEEITQEELHKTMDSVLKELNTDVLTNLTTDSQKEIINDIIINMEAYKADKTHNYKKAAESTYEKYKLLSEDEREVLKYEVQIRNSTKDLLILQEFFFPDLEI